MTGSNGPTLDDLHQKIRSWPVAPADLAGPEERLVEVFEAIDLDCPRSFAWDNMIDTSTANEAAGYPKATFTEEESGLVGRIGSGRLAEEFVEHPWEWQAGRWLTHHRSYSKGFLSHNVITLLIEDNGPAQCTAWLYIGNLVKPGTGAKLVPRFIDKVVQGYKKHMVAIADAYRAGEEFRPAVESAQPARSREDIRRAVTTFLDSVAGGHSPQFLEDLQKVILEKPVEDLVRINPRQLTGQHLNLKELLSCFMAGVKAGTMQLSWDVVCPHCRGVRESLPSLAELPSAVHCNYCRLDFGTGARATIEAGFSFHPRLIQLTSPLYCSREAARKPHVLMQKRIEPGEHILELDGTWPAEGLQATMLGQDHPLEITSAVNATKQTTHVRLSNTSNQTEYVTLAVTGWSDNLLLPEFIIAHPDFQALFPDDAPPSDLSVDLGVYTFFFTDIVGSTDLYNRLGDAEAFRVVRKHFVTIYEMVTGNDGTVVKTLGDGTMSLFADPANAFKAAVKLQRAFKQAHDVGLRIAINTGECLAVRLTTGMDFFGRAVNLASKLLDASDAGQIVFPAKLEEEYNPQGTYSFVNKNGQKTETPAPEAPAPGVSLFKHKAYPEPVPIRKVKIES